MDSWKKGHPEDDLSGVLLYAKTDEVFEELTTVFIDHPLNIKVLDLSSDWHQIQNKLDQIASMLE